jgi:hypothetical protein
LKVKEGFSGIAQEMYKVCLCSPSTFDLVVNEAEWNRSRLLQRTICWS